MYDPKNLAQLKRAMYPMSGYIIQVMYSLILLLGISKCMFVDLDWRRVRTVNEMKQIMK